jgi:rhamnose utilization protein RhaD (predicted bifunctional aldolase and dehydrogenase)
MLQLSNINELVEISRFAGSDVLLTQGAGGNTSVKSDDEKYMWIKASGFRLSEVSSEIGFVQTDLPNLLSIIRDYEFNDEQSALMHEQSVTRIQATTIKSNGLRPSLETVFHAVLPRVVIHTHPVYTNAFACMEDGEAALNDVLGKPVAWTRYIAPGCELGLEVARAYASFQQLHGVPPAQILLSNHGLITAANSGAESIFLTQQLVNVGEKFFGPLCRNACAPIAPPMPLCQWAQKLEAALQKRLMGNRSVAVQPTARSVLIDASSSPNQYLTAGPLVPDDVVFLGPHIWLAEASDLPERWIDTFLDTLPEKMVIVVIGLGVVFVGPNLKFIKSMEENLMAHVLVRQLIMRCGRARALRPEAIDYLASMESEKYRQSISEDSAVVLRR